MTHQILVYGAYGYTGGLIVNELVKLKMHPLLSGRNEQKLIQMATKFHLNYQVVYLDDETGLRKFLEGVTLVIHCAGPFIYTSKPMIEACLATGTHYIDITGEFNVFDLAYGFDEKAQQAGVMLLPGAGFDVVPSDCLANELKKLLPEADTLNLAFTTKGGRLSRGTAKTMVENVDKGHLVRKNGTLVKHPLGRLTKQIDYGLFNQLSVGISWGDISSAYYSTGISNITVFTGTDTKQLRRLKMAHRLRGILRLGFVKKFIQKQIDKKPAGPSESSRKRSETYLWGEALGSGSRVELRLKLPNGYSLTASAIGLITQKILNDDLKLGYQTPSTAFGSDLIYEVEGSERLNY
ncbi:MAG: saccharopine dehydrogenase NADP-binding domain-containing protein [Bacteroidota bacterium]